MRVLKIIVLFVVFTACVFLATANMHEVRLVFPQLPVRGWPHVEDVYAPLFVVILTTLLLGIVLAGMSTLFEQLRLRTVARRARKERERAIAARQAAEREREAAVQERDGLRAELAQAQGDLQRVRGEVTTVRNERDSVRGELARVREELDTLRREPPTQAPTNEPAFVHDPATAREEAALHEEKTLEPSVIEREETV